MDLVSIIMPSYNTAYYIDDAIQSILSQTYVNWELLIVDDCSFDDTGSVIEKYLDDSRIHYYKNSYRSGAAFSRNKALREAKGRWIAFLDSDDLWTKDKLDKQIRFMERHHYSFSYTCYSEIDVDGKETGVLVGGPRKITKSGMYNYCWPGCLTVMYDYKSIGLIQVYDIKKNNDYAMWLKISKMAECYLLDENLASYRRGRRNSISNSSIRELITWHYVLFHEADNHTHAISVMLTFRNLFFGCVKKLLFVKHYEVDIKQ